MPNDHWMVSNRAKVAKQCPHRRLDLAIRVVNFRRHTTVTTVHHSVFNNQRNNTVVKLMP
jgi:hypothetical protein